MFSLYAYNYNYNIFVMNKTQRLVVTYLWLHIELLSNALFFLKIM